jgi:hypothetical protein
VLLAIGIHSLCIETSVLRLAVALTQCVLEPFCVNRESHLPFSGMASCVTSRISSHFAAVHGRVHLPAGHSYR